MVINGSYLYIIYFFIVVIANGCSPHINNTNIDSSNGRFDTSENADVIVNDNIDINKFNSVLIIASYITNNYFDNIKLTNNLISSLKKRIDFKNFYSFPQLNDYLYKEILSTKESMRGNENKIIMLTEQFHKDHGKFYVIYFEARKPPGFYYEGNLKVYEPVTNKLVFHAYHKSFAWNGLDKPLFNPLLNSLIDWIKSQQQKQP